MKYLVKHNKSGMYIRPQQALKFFDILLTEQFSRWNPELFSDYSGKNHNISIYQF